MVIYLDQYTSLIIAVVLKLWPLYTSWLMNHDTSLCDQYALIYPNAYALLVQVDTDAYSFYHVHSFHIAN